ncbi:MAG: bifunctional adenosylcobinamide kinase/adenosylcobinamide-phosphate guanylyltransferase [Desulfobacteraceae bacterium]|nr:MAG: bifunctional adenosylcobinamide kinase/adenosylcobinamide-phosphate guanylyltransferase [Desulfobacteraceae bacterium]
MDCLTTLIIGGCRSGKSRLAVTMGDAMPARRKWFVATCQPQDAEMVERVRHHQEERGPDWHTIEAPLELTEAVAQHSGHNDLVLIDCLTLWASNLMMTCNDAAIWHHVDQLCKWLGAPPCQVILVTNEVGGGIVPENAVARRYRDLVGRLNQQIAAASQRVIWMVAGIAVTIKPGR